MIGDDWRLCEKSRLCMSKKCLILPVLNTYHEESLECDP